MNSDELLRNPFWHALGTEHAHLAHGSGAARRYSADVIPFAGIESHDPAALRGLRALMNENESVFVMSRKDEGSLPRTRGLLRSAEFDGLQMVYTEPREQEKGPLCDQIELLSEANIPEMLALKAIAFPGYFGPRATSLGAFYGIREGGKLVAMAGERLALPEMREISAVCTHPAHLGKGYAAALVRRIRADHAARGIRSILHVTAANARAIALYERLGFRLSRHVRFRELRRTVESCSSE